MQTIKKVVIAGGSGFIGKSLTKFFKKKGCEIYILTRAENQLIDGINYLNWDGKNTADWVKSLENTDILINLTGKSVQCLFDEENKKEIIRSRIDSVNVLNKAILTLENPPKLYLQASGLGFYGNAKDLTTEDFPNGSDFIAQVTKQWEDSFFKTETPKTRKVALRFGLALEKDGGALKPLAKLTRNFLGGAIGDGKLMMAWFHVKELNNIISFLYEKENLNGFFNICSPKPIRNKDFMKSLRFTFKTPWSPPVPKFIFKLVAKYIIKVEPELVLSNQNIIPKRLIDAGYEFKFTKLDDIFNEIYFKNKKLKDD